MVQRKPRSGGRGQKPSPQRTQPPAVSRADIAASRDRLQKVIEPVVEAAGYDLDGLRLRQVGRRFQVQVTVDGDSVGLDAIADVSRAISTALDEADQTGPELVPGEYQLEVSSPGVDRPLTLPRHWRRNKGRLVKVTAGGVNVTGRITEATDDAVTIESDGNVESYGYTDLGPGRIQIEFNRLEEISDDDLEVFSDSEDDDAEDSADDDSEDELDDSDDLESEGER